MSEYTEKVNKFLVSVGGSVKVKFLRHGKHFIDDRAERDIYQFTIKRRGKSYSGQFGQSIYGTERKEFPTAYDILACLTKCDPETFENFCAEFGYDTDSRKAETIYKQVKKEWAGIKRVFGDMLDALQEIS